jgi:serine O-acetyltransferase
MIIKNFVGNMAFWKLYSKCSDVTKNAIQKDTIHKSEKKFTKDLLKSRLEDFPQFRNIYVWRVEHDTTTYATKKLWLKFLNKAYPQQSTVEIYVRSSEIGENFWLPHRYCVINAEKIGKNVSILQGVTIGDDHKGQRPVIGDNVVIYPNAVVAGGISIGSNVYIGAGSFVNFDVPDGSTVRATKASYTIYQG